MQDFTFCFYMCLAVLDHGGFTSMVQTLILNYFCFTTQCSACGRVLCHDGKEGALQHKVLRCKMEARSVVTQGYCTCHIGKVTAL